MSQPTVLEVINKTIPFFDRVGLESPRLEIELLLAHVLDVPRLTLYLQFDRPVPTTQLDTLRELVRRRAAREPLQYITGTTEFCGLTIQCEKEVLIPRPETELLVEWILEEIKADTTEQIIDIGTGSGAIALALAQALPHACISGIDNNPQAIQLARKNQAALGRNNVSWHEATFTEADLEPYTWLVANLPYLTRAEMESLQAEVQQEPTAALSGGEDGLDAIRALLDRLPPSLGNVFLEVGNRHEEQLMPLLKTSGFHAQTRADQHGIRRFIYARR